MSELISAHLGEAKAPEAASTPLKFHDQIRGLWEYDAEIQLSDAEIKRGAEYTAALVDEELITGGIPELATYR